MSPSKLIAAVVVAGVFIAALALAQPPAPATRAAARVQYEYGELRLYADRAVLLGETGIQQIEPPEDQEPTNKVSRNPLGLFETRRDLRFYFLNIIGRDGWLLDTEKTPEFGAPYLVRRPM